MNLEKYIGKNDHGYFIRINNLVMDSEIAGHLDLTYDEYIGILKQHNAFYYRTSGYLFDNLNDLELALMTLEPYIIMEKLMEGSL